MKKLLLLAAALVMSVGAWAQTNYAKKSDATGIHTGFTEGSKYVVDIQVRNNCNAQGKSPLYLKNNAKSYNTDYTVFPSDFVWEVEGTSTGFKLKSVSNSQYFNYKYNNVADMVETQDAQFTIDDNGYLSPTTSNKAFATGRNLENNEYYPISYWDYATQAAGQAEAAVFTFYEVEETSAEVVLPKAFPEAGTYYMTFKNGDTNNRPYIYNSIGDSQYTLQSQSLPNPLTNGFVWKVTTDGENHITSMTDGTGQNVGVNGQFKGRLNGQFTLAKQSNGSYYITSDQIKGVKNDHECLNRSNGGYKNGTDWTLTTWVGANHSDNQWSIDKANFTGEIYDVEVTGADGYAIYNSQNALNGGFFFGENITKENVTASEVNGHTYEVTVTDHTIHVAYTQVATPIEVTYHIFVEGTEVATKVVNEYEGQPTTFTLSHPDYVNVTGIPETVSAASVNVMTTYAENVLPFKTDGTKYNLKENRDNALWIYVDPTNANDLKTIANQTPDYGTQDYYKWVFEGNWYTGFSIKNVKTQKYVTYRSVTPADNAGATQTETLAAGAYFDYETNGTHNFFKVHGSANSYISNHGGPTNQNMTNWNSKDYNDKGSQILISVAEDIALTEPRWDALKTAIDNTQNYTIGDKLGEYTYVLLNTPSNDIWNTTISYYQGVYEAKTATAEEVESAITAVNNMILHLQINQPKSGSFLRVQNNASSKYVSSNANAGNMVPMVETADATSILYYDGEKLIGYMNGLGFINTHTAASVSQTKETISFSEASVKGKYILQSNYSGSKCWHGSGATLNRNSAADANCIWNLTEVTELPVAFHANGKNFATVYSPVALEIPEGVTAYVGKNTKTENEKEYLVLEEIAEGQVIPANQGVVLEGTAGQTVDFTISSEESTLESTLTGTVATKAHVDSYVFSIVSENPGFYKLAETANLTGFKAYYVPTTPSEVQGFVLNFGGESTTGIESLIQKSENGISFDLQGRRVNANVKGISIVNNKKVIR